MRCFCYHLQVSKLRSEEIKLQNFKTMSFGHQYLNLTLKSPIKIEKNVFPHIQVPKFHFKFYLSSSCVWLGDLWRRMKIQTFLPILIPKVILSVRYEIFNTLKEREYPIIDADTSSHKIGMMICTQHTVTRYFFKCWFSVDVLELQFFSKDE